MYEKVSMGEILQRFWSQEEVKSVLKKGRWEAFHEGLDEFWIMLSWSPAVISHLLLEMCFTYPLMVS